MSQYPPPDRNSRPLDDSSREGAGGRPRTRSSFAPVGLLVAVAAATALLAGEAARPEAPVYPPGAVAGSDVRAGRDFAIPDLEATMMRRREAGAAVPAVYDFDPAAVDNAMLRLDEDLQEILPPQAGPEGPMPFDGEAAARALAGRWHVEVAPGAAASLEGPGAVAELVEGVRDALAGAYRGGVAATRDLLPRRMVLRDLTDGTERPLEDPSAVADFDDVRTFLAPRPPVSSLDDLVRAAAVALLRPNLTPNNRETAARRVSAREAVTPVLYLIRQGEILVREGDRVTPEQSRRLEAHARVAGTRGTWRRAVGLAAMTALLVGCFFRLGRGNVRKFRGGGRDAWFLAGVWVVLLLVERAGFLSALGLARAWPGPAADALVFALPLAAGPLAVRVVLNTETALLFTVPFVVAAALPFGSFPVALVTLMAGAVTGCRAVARASRRIDFLLAGAWTGAAQAVILLAAAGSGGWGLPGATLPWAAGWAFVGGVSSGVVAGFLVALSEWCLGYTTETRLLELASLDHPLLRDLMLRAPGTYHHSIVTGSLVKAAAEAIGARALLATVAAYYHDVGKVSKPAYYIENQSEGRNRHDKLSPSMSSLILTSHVREGVELARQHRLGRDLTAIIQEHHGTSLIRFFYERACQRATGGGEVVSDTEYRYPGPKPQTREAALVLLADAVEAASRTVPDPRPARFRGLVQNIINRTFTDGQLDECNLTLRDLHQIARSFSGILAGIHHQRIDYPLAAHKDRHDHGDLDPKRPAGNGAGPGASRPEGSERLKRLGL